jgi:hypothetical protein
MKRTLLLTAILALGVSWLLTASVGASVTPSPAVPIGDPGTCYDASIDCGYMDGSTWTVQESPGAYDYSPDAYSGRCRTRHAEAVRKNLFGWFVFGYIEQVKWCWNGTVVTKFFRDRWNNGTGPNYTWVYDGHMDTNCGPVDKDHCTGKVGASPETAWTEGHYHVCLAKWAVCNNKYPIVSITVRADGSSDASWSGA